MTQPRRERQCIEKNAFVNAIHKVARSYAELGIFP